MMFRLARFLIITFTLGRIKWLMRLTWVWRLIVFLGITGWLSKKLRQKIGLDKSPKSDVDSAWAEALRYTPSPAGAAAGAGTASTASPPASQATPEPVSETLSEVTGVAADGTSETITLSEARTDGETETVARIADDEGNIETVVTGSPVEEIDLVHLGSQAADAQAVEDVVEAEIEAETAVDEILDTLEAAEPEAEEVEVATIEAVKPDEVEDVEIVEARVEDVDADLLLIEPDWVRGDGSHDCPDSHPVKAKASSMIYYIPESGHYGLTIPDVCFATDLDAEAAGYRAPRR